MRPITPLSANAVTNKATPTAANTASDSGDFSRVFSEAMMQTLTDNAVNGMSGNSSAMIPGSSLGDLQTTLLAGAANGQTGDQEMVMFMMMMMMQEFSGSDLAPMLGALTSMLPSSSGSSSSSAIPVGYDGKINVRPSSLSWQKNSASDAFLPAAAWLPASFRTAGKVNNRSANNLRQVIGQFDVESAERYRPYKNGNTYCNIFVWDVTSALGCEIPHYVDRDTGAPRVYPDTKGAYELDANGTHDWLAKHGANYGWYEVSAEDAQRYANAGYPAVTAWKNSSGGAGHVQVVCPAKDNGYDARRGVTVAQAGSKNYAYAHLNATMSKDKIPNVRYYIHA